MLKKHSVNHDKISCEQINDRDASLNDSFCVRLCIHIFEIFHTNNCSCPNDNSYLVRQTKLPSHFHEVLRWTADPLAIGVLLAAADIQQLCDRFCLGN